MRHGAPIFMPPGEVVTITLPEGAVGKVYVSYNKYMQDVGLDANGNPKFTQRINRMRTINIHLNQKVNTLEWPYGASPTFVINGDEPISFEISGVILSPFFKAGVIPDEDFEIIKKYPRPVIVFDTGNIVAYLSSIYIRQMTRANDVMKYWRSAYQISL